MSRRRYRSVAVIAAALLLPLNLVAAETVPSAASAPAKEAPRVDAKAAKKARFECESAASSRIQRRKAAECVPASVPTRSYTKEQLDSTGQIDVGEALKRLDPRFH